MTHKRRSGPPDETMMMWSIALDARGRIVADDAALRRWLGLAHSLRGRPWQYLRQRVRNHADFCSLSLRASSRQRWLLLQTSTSTHTAANATATALQHQAESFAMLAHELRTPLNALLGMAQLLGDTTLDAEQRGYVGTLIQSGELLTTLINDILDAARLDLGHLQLETRDFDLEELIDGLLHILTPKARDKGLDLSVHFAPQTQFALRGDPQRLRQILLNLLGNALKFTAHGQIHLDIATRTEAAVCHLSITVEDTGIGMSEAQIERLFRSFSQGHAAIHRQYGGSGLGLVISRSLARLMGGDIWVHSMPQRGSVFGLSLPLLTAERPAPATPAQGTLRLGLIEERPGPLSEQLRAAGYAVVSGQRFGVVAAADVLICDLDHFERLPRRDDPTPPCLLLCDRWSWQRELAAQHLQARALLRRPLRLEHLAATLAWLHSATPPAFITLSDLHERHRQQRTAQRTARRHEGWHVLIVDDNPVNLLISRRSLERLGCLVHGVSSGAEALNAAQARVFDLVLMDCEMPEMDGREATRALRSMASYRDTPIIAFTAHSPGEQRHNCLAAGMNEVLGKPLSPDRLLDVLERYLPDYRQVDDVQMLHSKS